MRLRDEQHESFDTLIGGQGVSRPRGRQDDGRVDAVVAKHEEGGGGQEGRSESETPSRTIKQTNKHVYNIQDHYEGGRRLIKSAVEF